jgi:hypothetical protein
MACADRTVEWAMVGREFRVLSEFLAGRGYVETQSEQGPGTFTIVGQDGAPGWGEWMYWVVVHEDPARPVLEEAARLLGV